jgi:hypothetical protein
VTLLDILIFLLPVGSTTTRNQVQFNIATIHFESAKNPDVVATIEDYGNYSYLG